MVRDRSWITPLEVSSDRHVVVVGCGAAGLAAALAAARSGARTTVVESAGFVGGNSAMLAWLGFHSRQYQQVVKGIPLELVRRLQALNAASGIVLDPVVGSAVSLNSAVYRWLAMELLAEANVRVMLHSQVIDVERTGDHVTGVVIQQRSSQSKVQADVLVDASGDGELSYLAGARWEKGRTEDGRVQAPTLVFRVGRIDRDAFVGGLRRSAFRDLLAHYPDVYAKLRSRLPQQKVIVIGGFAELMAKEARDGGLADVPSSRVVGVKTHIDDEFIAISTKVASFDPTDSDSLSDAYVTAYRQIPQLMTFFRKALPGFAKAELRDIAPMMGVRESRRIVGDYVLMEDDVQSGATFDDGVCMGAYHIDIHTPDGSWVDSRSVQPYDIPLRSLVVAGVDNLLVAGKCMSASHEAIASTRTIPICMAQGHAAGMAAARAVFERKSPREVDVRKLRQNLRDTGAALRDDLEQPNPELLSQYGYIG